MACVAYIISQAKLVWCRFVKLISTFRSTKFRFHGYSLQSSKIVYIRNIFFFSTIFPSRIFHKTYAPLSPCNCIYVYTMTSILLFIPLSSSLYNIYRTVTYANITFLFFFKLLEILKLGSLFLFLLLP